MNQTRDAMDARSTDLEFINYDDLGEDVVENIKSLLKHPCSAVQLPDDVYYEEGEDEAYEQEDEEVDLKQGLADDSALDYGATGVSILGPYGAPIPQGPLYPIATTVGANFIAAGNHIQQVVFVQKMINGEATALAAANPNNPVLDSLPTVVSSNPYQPISVYHYPHPPPPPHPHHTPQYVMSSIHPTAYINPYMQPAVTVCDPTIMATGPSAPCTAVAPNFIAPHGSMANSLPIQMASQHTLSEMVPPCTSVPVCIVEEAHLESVVVEVPPNNYVKAPQQSRVVEMPTWNCSDAVAEYVAGNTLECVQGEISFMCPDEIEQSASEVEAAVCDHNGDYETQEIVTDIEELQVATNSPPSDAEDDSPVVQNGDDEISSFTPSVADVAKDELSKPSENQTDDSVVEVAAVEKVNTARSWASLFKRDNSSASVATKSPVQNSRQSTIVKGTGELPKSFEDSNAGSAAESKPVGRRQQLDSKQRANENRSKENFRKEDPVQTSGSHKLNQAEYFTFGKILSKTVLDHRRVNYVPRGLSNSGNWCYINSILQALLACYPLYNLLLKLPRVEQLKNRKSMTPIMDSMIQFVSEFNTVLQQKQHTASSTSPQKRDEAIPAKLPIGQPFEPSYIYEMLSNLKLNAFEGRQEDAEEFLSCLLNGLHEEIVRAISCAEGKGVNNGLGSPASNGNVENNQVDNDSADEESWKVMESRSKFSVTRSASFSSSPLSDIFCGRMRSAVHASSTSSATLQPFFTLPLDIQSDNVHAVKDALNCFVMKEALQDYHCAKTKQEVTASRQITLEELPPVLILHLKRFVYCKDGGCMKLSKKVDFSVDLDLNKELISPTVRTKISTIQRSYKLVAVVYHCGSYAAKGHYITDVYHQGANVWLRADDHRVMLINESKVLKHPTNLVPYVLFYRRLDTTSSK